LQKVRLLQVEVELLDEKGSEALAVLAQLSVQNPEISSTTPYRLLKARAEIAVGGASTKVGLAELQKISTDAKDSPEGQVADLEVLLYRLQHGADVVADVAAWIEKNNSLSAGSA
jgi:hypothetical protein